MNLTTIIVIGIAVWVFHHYSGRWRIPTWVWKALLVFLVVMIIRNATSAWDLFKHQADEWWPIIQDNANHFLDGFRNFVKHISKDKG